jgi:hypothetical protein
MKKVLLVFLALIIMQCTNKIAGTTDETVSGTKAMLYYTDGSPVQGATIKIFEMSDTTRVPTSIASTDTKGQYVITNISKGTYNIWAEKDTLVAFQDSVLIYGNATTLKQDTVRPEGSITAIIGMQPNHDPRTAFVQILGSEHFVNVDSSGHFTMSGLTNGTYNLRIITSESKYTASFFSVNARAGKKDTLKDTLWLFYTGIPVVLGLSAIYDTSTGIVNLHWNRTAYRNFQDYLVFRDPYDSIRLSTDAFASSPDTFYLDTIFRANNPWNDPTFNDTDHKFKYRVCVEDNSQFKGLTYKYVTVTATSPNQGSLNLYIMSPEDTFFYKGDSSLPVNTAVTFKAIVKENKSSVAGITWEQREYFPDSTSTVIKTTSYSNSTIVADTVRINYPKAGYFNLTVTSTNALGYSRMKSQVIVVHNPITP